MIPTPKKLTYGSKKALKFRGASLLKIVTVEYSEDAGCTVHGRARPGYIFNARSFLRCGYKCTFLPLL